MGMPPLAHRPNPFDAWAGVGVRPAPGVGHIDTEFITGSAGTGKTYEVQRSRAADPEGVVVAATTGIAAVNLGPQVTTIHSLLKFYDYNSLVEAYTDGRLQRKIRRLVGDGMRELIVDEISMFCAPAMDILYAACNEVAQPNDDSNLKLTPVGDFCQLPPIADTDTPTTGKYAFEADCWVPHFSPHTTRLTHIFRQEDIDFVHALQAARRGAGEETLAYLQRVGVRFERSLSNTFDGTTLCANNHEVDVYNRRRLYLVPPEGGDRVPCVESTRWASPGPDGRPPSEWQQIPPMFPFKLGAYVMILSNDTSGFTWANGDCGTLVGATPNQFAVRLKRNGREVVIGKVTRTLTTRQKPAGINDAGMIVVGNMSEYDDMVRANGEPLRQVVMLREPRPTWITGWIRYLPVRLAYATTVHKSQGLSLDAIQLDLTPGFLGAPAMMYVALSRCRTAGGLVLVGSPDQVGVEDEG